MQHLKAHAQLRACSCPLTHAHARPRLHPHAPAPSLTAPPQLRVNLEVWRVELRMAALQLAAAVPWLVPGFRKKAAAAAPEPPNVAGSPLLG